MEEIKVKINKKLERSKKRVAGQEYTTKSGRNIPAKLAPVENVSSRVITFLYITIIRNILILGNM